MRVAVPATCDAGLFDAEQCTTVRGNLDVQLSHRGNVLPVIDVVNGVRLVGQTKINPGKVPFAGRIGSIEYRDVCCRTRRCGSRVPGSPGKGIAVVLWRPRRTALCCMLIEVEHFFV